MLVSTTHSFVFIHINRTGGTSITSALRPFSVSRPRSRIARFLTRYGLLRNPEKMDFPPHLTAQAARKLLPKGMYNSYLTAAFIRNPWSWLAALYNAIQKSEGHRHQKRVAGMSDFATYIDWEIARNKRSLSGFTTDREGKIMVDFIGRFENLHEDFDRLCRAIGIEPVPLPHASTQRPHPDYREYYTDATRKKVAEHWKRDIEMFGYDFDGITPAGRGMNLGRKSDFSSRPKVSPAPNISPLDLAD